MTFVQALKVGVCGDGVVVVASEYPEAIALAVESVLGKQAKEFRQDKGDPGYSSAVTVNTGRGVLKKVGGIGGGVSVTKQEEKTALKQDFVFCAFGFVAGVCLFVALPKQSPLSLALEQFPALLSVKGDFWLEVVCNSGTWN